MAYILREYRCTCCGHRWESLTVPNSCPKAPDTCPNDGWHPVSLHYKVERVIAVPAHGKHSSWESWRK